MINQTTDKQINQTTDKQKHNQASNK